MEISDPINVFLGFEITLQAVVILLILMAIQQIRQGHIGRVGIASAGVLVFVTAYPIWTELHAVWRGYTAVAVLFALIAGASYLTKTSLKTEFYRIAIVLYGGIPLILVFLYGLPL